MASAGAAHEALVREARKARLLLEAARYLGETLEPLRVYERFVEILDGAIPYDGVVVSSYDDGDGLIRCDYAWVEGARLDTSIFPPLRLNTGGGGMQSQVIRSGESLLVNDVAERVKDKGTYYDVDREGHVRKVPESGAPGAQAAMMVPVKHEGRVVGVVQVMSDRATYDREQLELVEGLVGQMAAAIRNARLSKAAADAHAAEAAAQAVAAEREHAAQVLDAVGDGIFLVNGEGVIRFWNHAAAQITGLPGDRARGERADRIFPLWRTIVEDVPVADDGASARQVTMPLDVDGRELWLAFVAVRSPEGVVYAFRDLTAERSLDRAKNDFIATVSHELRTPMTGVLGAAKTLLRRDVEFTPELQRELLEMIATQASRLSQVTEEVLLASSLEGGLRIESGEVDVAEVVREAVAAMRSQLPDGVALTLRIRTGGTVLGDRDRVAQVLVNLIDNALKYSPSGSEVAVTTSRVRNHVRVAVRDRGAGIPPEEQDRIFERFYRLDPHVTHGPGGTGLGLYICRELVERMGGRIGVRSEPGRGSTFYFDLAAARAG